MRNAGPLNGLWGQIPDSRPDPITPLRREMQNLVDILHGNFPEPNVVGHDDDGNARQTVIEATCSHDTNVGEPRLRRRLQCHKELLSTTQRTTIRAVGTAIRTNENQFAIWLFSSTHKLVAKFNFLNLNRHLPLPERIVAALHFVAI